MADDADRAQAVLDRAMHQYRRPEPVVSLRLRQCRSCYEPIPLERLSVAPYATRCLPCQRLHELTHGR